MTIDRLRDPLGRFPMVIIQTDRRIIGTSSLDRNRVLVQNLWVHIRLIVTKFVLRPLTPFSHARWLGVDPTPHGPGRGQYMKCEANYFYKDKTGCGCNYLIREASYALQSTSASRCLGTLKVNSCSVALSTFPPFAHKNLSPPLEPPPYSISPEHMTREGIVPRRGVRVGSLALV